MGIRESISRFDDKGKVIHAAQRFSGELATSASPDYEPEPEPTDEPSSGSLQWLDFGAEPDDTEEVEPTEGEDEPDDAEYEESTGGQDEPEDDPYFVDLPRQQQEDQARAAPEPCEDSADDLDAFFDGAAATADPPAPSRPSLDGTAARTPPSPATSERNPKVNKAAWKLTRGRRWLISAVLVVGLVVAAVVMTTSSRTPRHPAQPRDALGPAVANVASSMATVAGAVHRIASELGTTHPRLQQHRRRHPATRRHPRRPVHHKRTTGRTHGDTTPVVAPAVAPTTSAAPATTSTYVAPTPVVTNSSPAQPASTRKASTGTKASTGSKQPAFGYNGALGPGHSSDG